MTGAFQEVDFHGMNRTQAFAAIDAKLRRAGGTVYTLHVIHCYHGGTFLRDAIRAHYRSNHHGGTVLRDAIRAHYRSNPKVVRIELGLNSGETDLILRDL